MDAQARLMKDHVEYVFERIGHTVIDLSDDEIAAPLTIWGRETDRKSLLFHLLAELIHHNGQIAMLGGIYRRSGSD